ncbi:MAG: hypothetical protein ACXWBO_15420, partial [Ilumatobacteraceae bacterium]
FSADRNLAESQQVRDAVQKRVGLKSDEFELSVVGDEPTRTLTLTAVGDGPDKAKTIADTYASVVLELRKGQLQSLYADSQRYVQAQIDASDAALAKNEAALSAVAQGNDAGGGDSAQAITERLNLGIERSTLEIDRRRLLDELGAVQLGSTLATTDASTAIEPADLPTAASRSIPRNVAVALIVSALIGIGLAFVIDTMDQRVVGKKDLQRLVAPLPLLATASRAETATRRRDRVATHDLGEAFRLLALSLGLSRSGAATKTVTISSPTTAENSVDVAANFAVALAGDHRRVVLVDADSSSSGLVARFGLTVQPASDCDSPEGVSSALTEVEAHPGLSILTTGPSASDRWPKASASIDLLLDALSSHGDVVVVASPPILGSSRAALIAAASDVVVVVAAAGRTRGPDIEEAIELLQQVDAPVAGVFLTEFDQRATGYSS